jgi:hypothetical protein
MVNLLLVGVEKTPRKASGAVDGGQDRYAASIGYI